MTLAAFIQLAKRLTNYGDVNNTSDRSTTDIIGYLNNRRYDFWLKHPWDWSVTEISQAYSAGATSITFTDTGIGQILILRIQGQLNWLRPISMRYYLEWKGVNLNKSATDDRGTFDSYVRMGRTSANLFKIKPVLTPDSGGVLEGLAKTRLTEYSVADIATNTGLEFFPAETHHILLAGVLADIKKAMKMPEEALVEEERFKKDIDDLIAEDQVNKPDEVPTIQPPDYVRLRRRIRKLRSSYNV